MGPDLIGESSDYPVRSREGTLRSSGISARFSGIRVSLSVRIRVATSRRATQLAKIIPYVMVMPALAADQRGEEHWIPPLPQMIRVLAGNVKERVGRVR